jgi:hypothetical protein
MAVYKQFNTNEVVVSPFKANKRFRFEGSQITASDAQIEYYQSQQGRYLSGSYDTGFNTMQDGVTVFNSIKQLYYSNYLTSSWGDPMVTASFRSGGTGPQQQNLGRDTIVGNITGPRFENFLQSSLVQDRKFAQFSASIAPIGFAGTDTGVSQSITVAYDSTVDTLNLAFPVGNFPDLGSVGINDTYVLNNVTWESNPISSPFYLNTGVAPAPFIVGAQISNTGTTPLASSLPDPPAFINAQPISSFTYTGAGTGATIKIFTVGGFISYVEIDAPGTGYKAGEEIEITVGQLFSIQPFAAFSGGPAKFVIQSSDLDPRTNTVDGSLLAPEGVNPQVDTDKRGLTLKNNNLISFVAAGGAGNLSLNYLQAPKGPSVISIPSMLYGEAIQPSSFQFEYTSSLNYTKSIVDDDGQGNLIVTQSKADGTPFFSGSVGQIFYSQGIAVITGPDSGSLREFAYNVGYKNNINPNIVSSSLSYSSSITIDENQYKCTVRDSEFTYTTNPSALGVPGVLTTKPGQLFSSFNVGNLIGLNASQTFTVQPKTLLGTTNASTYYVFKDQFKESIGQQYRIELRTGGDERLEFVGFNGFENGSRNALGQSQFNSTGSATGIAQAFCDAVNSVNGLNGEISCSLFTTNVANDSVHLIQSQAGKIGNTQIKYADSFNLLTNQDANYQPNPSRGQQYFGNTSLGQATYNVNGVDTFAGTKGAILNITTDSAAPNANIISIEVSQSLADNNTIPPTISETFGGKNYSVGDKLEIAGTDLGGSGTGFINLVEADVDKSENTQIYHDFCTGSLFTPYVTTVGLYNDSNDLVCVGKLPRPLPISLSTDTTFMINFDTN